MLSQGMRVYIEGGGKQGEVVHGALLFAQIEMTPCASKNQGGPTVHWGATFLSLLVKWFVDTHTLAIANINRWPKGILLARQNVNMPSTHTPSLNEQR